MVPESLTADLILALFPQQYSVYPIIWAAGRGHAEIVHLLLQHGAKVNCSDKVTNAGQMFYYAHLSCYYSNSTHRGNHLYKIRRVHLPLVFPFVTTS